MDKDPWRLRTHLRYNQAELSLRMFCAEVSAQGAALMFFMLSFVVGWTIGHGVFLVAGWGYDEQVPLRPWPQITRRKEGLSYTRLTLAGFFLHVGSCSRENNT